MTWKDGKIGRHASRAGMIPHNGRQVISIIAPVVYKPELGRGVKLFSFTKRTMW